MIQILAVLVCLLLCQGCVSTLKSEAELNGLIQRHGLGTLYYIGSESGFHFFATKYFLERTKYYRLSDSDYHFRNRFPKTKDKTKWVPYTRDLNANEKGFYGEPQEPIQSTNSATRAVPLPDKK